MIIGIIWSAFNTSFGMRVRYNLKIKTLIQNGLSEVCHLECHLD